MSRVRVHNLAVSLDGYAAGPDQSAGSPLGVGGTRLHEWVFATRAQRPRAARCAAAVSGCGPGAVAVGDGTTLGG
jgi:hypothetical protein